MKGVNTYEPLNLEKEQINKHFISYLISNEYEFKKKDIAKVLNISRAKLYRKLNGEGK